MKIKMRFISAVGVLVLASLACGSQPSAPANNPTTEQPATEQPSGGGGTTAASGVTITSVTMYRDDGSGQPGDEVTSFKPADRVQHFLAKADGLQASQKVKLVFTAVDTTAGKDIKVAEAETGEILVADQITGQVSLPNDWPVGSYRFDIYVDDNLVYSWDYAVKE